MARGPKVLSLRTACYPGQGQPRLLPLEAEELLKVRTCVHSFFFLPEQEGNGDGERGVAHEQFLQMFLCWLAPPCLPTGISWGALKIKQKQK